MEIYNDRMELIENPDLELGYLTESTKTVHHEAIEGVEEVWHFETLKEYPNGGKDVIKVVDVEGVEAVPAWDEEVPIYIYTPYTAEELEKFEKEKNEPTMEERLATLEEENAHLKEALELLLSGEVE